MLFRLDVSSLGSHLNERQIRGEEESYEIEEKSDAESRDDVSVEGLVDMNTESTQHLDSISSDGELNINGISNLKSASDSLISSNHTALGIGSSTASNKYLASDPSHDNTLKDHSQEAKRTSMREKPYLSKAERRKLKKCQKDIADDASIEHVREDCKENSRSGMKTDEIAQHLKPPGGKTSRGQKSKLKKIKGEVCTTG
ncbi:zinc knuckle (CCHC-type) family protein [Thalictrum thalictroides]|uniref:Zinc knuckle (CCHC-type) family protein n=1 Tax=Thalictrum thalictroides TaxID=46969 RepID=A0A7J6WL85_THATH|nr:zinc knuckle (CCHC-type) family protein [Thalictrum thalictroides]